MWDPAGSRRHAVRTRGRGQRAQLLRERLLPRNGLEGRHGRRGKTDIGPHPQ